MLRNRWWRRELPRHRTRRPHPTPSRATTSSPAAAAFSASSPGTATNVSVLDPNFTALGNAGTVVVVACPATGVRYILVAVAAVSATTNLATRMYRTPVA